MTVESCTTFCSSKGYAVAGLEYASQCWCGSSLTATATQVAAAECSLLCPGNNKEYCGAASLLDIYELP